MTPKRKATPKTKPKAKAPAKPKAKAPVKPGIQTFASIKKNYVPQTNPDPEPAPPPAPPKAPERKEVQLTAKQEMFVLEYLKDLNATQAAIRAGYSEKTASAVGYENLRKPQIAAAIAEAGAQRIERTEVDADWVLRESKLAFEACKNAGDYRTAKGYLELAGKHVAVGAFNDKLTLATDPDNPLLSGVDIVFVNAKEARG